MRVTSKGRYGLKAMLDLVDFGDAETLVKSREIAKRQAIPIKYLEQIINTLKKGGLVISVRGSEGGYRLARSADEISVYEVLQILEGDLSIVDKNDATWAAGQGQFWQEIEDRLVNLLNISLTSFSASSKKTDDSYMFYI